MSAADRFVEALEAHDRRPRGRDGVWVALCPAHDDRNASLSVTAKSDRVLVHCHAGCDSKDIAAAVGLEIKDLFDERSSTNSSIAAEYSYVDEGGKLLFDVLRLEPKGFRQRKADGTWKLGDTRRVIYRLPKVLEAISKGNEIAVVEGEKDVHSLEKIGVVATCNPAGAGKWRDSYSRSLAGAVVTVIADCDEPGRDHARKVATSLEGVAKEVALVEPSKGKDISDHLAAGGTMAELVEVPAGHREPEQLTDLFVAEILEKHPDLSADDLKDVKSLDDLNKLLAAENKATQIIRFIEEAGVTLFHDPEKRPYATFEVNGHSETHALRSKAFKLYARNVYYERTEAAPNGQSLTDALGALEAKAIFRGAKTPVHLRVAGDEGTIYIDLGDDAWRAIQITSAGWEVLDHHPVRFRRSNATDALPVPARGGSLELLRQFVNLASDDDWRLLVGWLLAAARPGFPFPVAVLHGEQGSAKSTTARVLRALIDPNAVSLRAAPHDIDDVMVSANASWVVSYDNLSRLQPKLSDALCRLSTGGGISKRELYTDADEMLLDVKRPVIINGIDELASRGDLLSRALMIELPVITEERRRPEKHFWKEFEKQHPLILGALCDALVGAVGCLGDVDPSGHPRMADFSMFATAAEPALGWEPGSFLEAFRDNQGESHVLAVESNPVGPLLRDLGDAGWQGELLELLDLLDDRVDERARKRDEWPTSSRALGDVIKRLAPNLRQLGYEVEKYKATSGQRRTMVRLERVTK